MIVRRSDKGFTLVELLVAVTIFTLLMGAVGAFYVSSLRAVRTGNQAIDVNQAARTVFSTVQRDLATAYAARDFGDTHTFYGTPIGMTFVGLARNYDSTLPADNLARVTYVMHWTAGTGTFDSEQVNELDGTFRYNTYGLLRVVEPNVDNLDEFPIDWAGLAQNLEFGGVRNLLDDACGCDYLTESGSMTALQEERVQSAKRLLWIQMLAGGAVDVDFNLIVPDFWTLPATDFNNDGEFEYPSDLDGDGEPDPPTDYLIGEDIVSRYPPLLPYDYGNAIPFFQYARKYDYESDGTDNDDDGVIDEAGEVPPNNFLNPGQITQYKPTPLETHEANWANINWVSWWNDYLGNPGDTALPSPAFPHPGIGGMGSPHVPYMPEVVRMNFTFRVASPYVGAPDTERRLTQVVVVPTGYTRTSLLQQ